MSTVANPLDGSCSIFTLINLHKMCTNCCPYFENIFLYCQKVKIQSCEPSLTLVSVPSNPYPPYTDVDLCMHCGIACAEITVLGGLVATKACWILRRHKVHPDEDNKNIVGMYAGVFCKSCVKFIILIQDAAIYGPFPLRLCINER